MTTEELEKMKELNAGTFVTKTATLEFVFGNPEPRCSRCLTWFDQFNGATQQEVGLLLNYWSCKSDRTLLLISRRHVS